MSSRRRRRRRRSSSSSSSSRRRVVVVVIVVVVVVVVIVVVELRKLKHVGFGGAIPTTLILNSHTTLYSNLPLAPITTMIYI